MAETNLGVLYVNGEGVVQSDIKAAAWYRKAAAQGYVIAETGLGSLYVLGQGVSQDDTLGLKWLILAKAGGSAVAARELRLAESITTRAHIAQAQTLAKQWWVAHQGAK